MNQLRRPIHRLLAGVLLLAAASCTSVEVRKDEPVSSWVARDSVSRKRTASLEIGGDRIAGRPVDEFFRRHSAIVSDGGTPRVELRGGDHSAQLWLPSDAGYGSAVSLGDGYFLTAAHVPVKGSGALFCMEHGDRPVVRPYRVVWKDRSADVALLHAPVDVPAVKWAESSALTSGAGVFTYGFGGGEWKPSHGQINGSQPVGDSRLHLDLKLSAPVVAGDSGGPVVTTDGRLAGIITRANYRWVRAFGRAWTRAGSHATRPELELLHGIIAKDQANRR